MPPGLAKWKQALETFGRREQLKKTPPPEKQEPPPQKLGNDSAGKVEWS